MHLEPDELEWLQKLFAVDRVEVTRTADRDSIVRVRRGTRVEALTIPFAVVRAEVFPDTLVVRAVRELVGRFDVEPSG